MHGPWHEVPAEYWMRDDALFRSEVGAPGSSPVAIIREFAGGLPELPATLENVLWRRTSWWIQGPEFLKEQGREPRGLEEFVAWSQRKHAAAFGGERFPESTGTPIPAPSIVASPQAESQQPLVATIVNDAPRAASGKHLRSCQ